MKTVPVLLALLAHSGHAQTTSAPAPYAVGSEGCIECHAGIEAMHPEAKLSCVDCHGGDGTARLKLEAHVARPPARGEDESTAVPDKGLAWRRFLNPMDLRVVESTCAPCHELEVDHLATSLHATTAGHLSDGYYEMGLSKERGSRYSVFPVSGTPGSGARTKRFVQVPEFMGHRPEDELATHFSDLARKECMQCHLWSQGRAVRGRVGFDGDYRGEGCAACHVEYALDGLSESGDRKRVAGEPGHPRRHSMTSAPTTATCTSCHYGDASIGLHFRGLSQLPPDVPGGPNIPGTTDKQLNRTFYLDDPSICPPDVHYERGMHCIDCHTQSDVMGDGLLHGQMEHAVEISCQACHGTFTEPTTLYTERGTPLEHLRREGDRVILTGKVSGEQHVVPQAAHVVDPDRPEYNPVAAQAMKPEHENVECYTCHAGWNVNFLGFHFSRNASLTQLDVLSGARTPGRVTTQEKVFATWKGFYAGRNERGAVAPYLTGFSTMGSVWDEDGELVLDQVLPETAAGLSGMTMVHHQLHSTRPTARTCIECHRAPATWGLGSANFRLGRQLAFVADRRGIEVVALERSELGRSAPLTKLPLPDVVALALECDTIQGHARRLFVAEGGRGIHELDVTNPLEPRRVAFHATVNPLGMELAGSHLFVADGIGGLRVLDVSEPGHPREVASLPTFEAKDVDVQWPWAYVADGPGGLVIVDVRAPDSPRIVTAADVNGGLPAPNDATHVEVLFQYSRPTAKDGVPRDRRTRARNLAAVLDARGGLSLVDVTEPTRPQQLYPEYSERSEATAPGDVLYRGLALLSQVDPADTRGGESTAERDWAYVLVERGSPANRRSSLLLFDVSDPTRVQRAPLREALPAGYSTEGLAVADFYNPPFRQRVVFTPGELGVYLADVSTSREPAQIGRLPGIERAYAIAIEEFPLDRMVAESGAPLKDISHPGSRWLERDEIERILTISAEDLGTDLAYLVPSEVHGETARLFFGRADRDGSGFLTGAEYEDVGGEGFDEDEDGRIALIELARHAGLLETVHAPDDAAATSSFLGERVHRDGDLARLLDGVDPFAFDVDHSLELDRAELESAFFAALDLDDDGALTIHELSRYPGPLRELRYLDHAARRRFGELELTPDGRIKRREFRLADAEWQALDADRDGGVRLLEGTFEFQRERGFARDGSEWPSRRDLLLPLPPEFTREEFLARFESNGDEVLSREELASRPDLLSVLDRDRSGSVDLAELDRGLGRLEEAGVDGTVDDFRGRWDLDRDGRVGRDELGPLAWLRLAGLLEAMRR